MDIRKLEKIVVTALADIKGEDIEIINTRKLTALFDRIVIASGSSNRQTKALARSVHDKVKEAGGNVIGMEGGDTGEWVLVDLGDIVVHIMQPAVRAYYNLEELWATKPSTDVVADKAPKKARAPRKVGAGDTPTKAPAKRAASKEAPAKRAASKEAPAKRAASKEAPAKRAAAPKAPARRTPAKDKRS